MQLISVLLAGTATHGCAVYESECLGRIHAEFKNSSRVFVSHVAQVGPDSWADLTDLLTPQIFKNIEAEIAAQIKESEGIAA